MVSINTLFINITTLRKLIVCVLLCLPSTSILAVTVDDLYVGEVLVSEESDAQLKEGAQAGLLQVLIRVAGSEGIQNSALVSNALRNPASYYYQYSYQSTDRTMLVDGETIAARVLRLNFEPSAIARLLREAGYSVWSSNRPGLLVWIALSDGSGRRLMSEDDGSDMRFALGDVAKQKGLPLLFPLLDLEDAASLSAAEVWGSFVDRIDGASVRYQPDAILSARVQRSGAGQWLGDWTYRIDDRWARFDNVADTPSELVMDVMDELTGLLVERYATDDSKGSVAVTIESINSLADYGGALAYMQKLAPVLDVEVLAVEEDRVSYKLMTEGSVDQLIELIELDQRMFLIRAPQTGKPMMLYRWLQ
jgi:hypothetical protein